MAGGDQLPNEGFPKDSREFFEQQYERDFETKYHNALRQRARDEWVTFFKVMYGDLAELDKSIHFVTNLFAPEVATALLQVKERARWASDLVRHSLEEDVANRNLTCIKLLASTIGKALRMICDQV